MQTPRPVSPLQINEWAADVAIQQKSAKVITTTKNTITTINNNSNRWVAILQGKHCGEILRFVKETPKRIAVQSKDDPTKIIYLLPNHVQLLDETITDDKENNGDDEENNGDDEEYDFVTVVEGDYFYETNSDSTAKSIFHTNNNNHNNAAVIPNLVVDPLNTNNNLSSKPPAEFRFQQGDIVDIIAGTHKGKSATFVKRTALRVALRLQGDPTIRYLAPDRIAKKVMGLSSPYCQGVMMTTNNANSRATSSFPATIEEDDHHDSISDAIVLAVKDYFAKVQRHKQVKVQDTTSDKRRQTLLGHIFQNDVHFVELDWRTVQQQLPRKLTIDKGSSSGLQFFLIAFKLHRTENAATCAYLQGSSPQEIASRLLTQLGALNTLAPCKAVARLELLLSTACTNLRTHSGFHIHSLPVCEFESIPEQGNVGCGFIPRHWINQFLSEEKHSNIISQRICALQVRIVIPNMGIYKGVLVEKPGIRKIQLPPSMRKVGSVQEIMTGVNSNALVLINQSGMLPFKARLLQYENRFAEERLIPEMAQCVLMQKGVSYTYLQKPNRYHSSLVGLADPTSSLSFGTIFVAGSTNFDFGAKVVISRFPMTEAADCLVVELVREKPSTMSQKSWEFLCQMPFGCVIFGNSSSDGNDNKNKAIYNELHALPELISQGDLDGDAYFVCWDPLIVQDALVGDRPVVAQKNNQTITNNQHPKSNQQIELVSSLTDSIDSCQWWFSCQEHMANLGTRARANMLIGALHNLWKARLKACLQQEAIAYGRAFKEAIDVIKHGGKVALPQALWKDVPESFHHCLKNKS